MRNFVTSCALSVSFVFAVGCASKILQYDKMRTLETNEEYEDKVKITELEGATPVPTPSISPAVEAKVPKNQSKSKPKKPLPKSRAKKQKEQVTPEDTRRQPLIEDSEGFAGRRPIKDPFRVGEDVTLAITYLRMTAGYINVKTLPFVQVNGEKSYHYQVTAKSNDFFSKFYSVDDYADTYVGFDNLLPQSLEVRVRESKQLKDIRSFIDQKNSKADYWEKRVTKEHGEESKKLQWDILPYTQNVISSAYYIRNFTYEVGKVYHFRVTDEGKNLVANIKCIRKEKLSTSIGDLNTIVIKPEFEIDGIFKPVGEIYIWLTDDDRKFIVRIESAIKIGTLVAKVRKIEPGTP